MAENPIPSPVVSSAIGIKNVLIRRAGDSPPHFALGFKTEKGDGT